MAGPEHDAFAGFERLLISDVDGTLLADGRTDGRCGELAARLRVARAGLVLATGRDLTLTLEASALLSRAGLPRPAALICSVGSEIYLGPGLEPDRDWTRHIAVDWDREAVGTVLAAVPGLVLQDESGQGPFKVSYVFEVQRPDAWRLVTSNAGRALEAAGLSTRRIASAGRFLDVLPSRASKGAAALWLMERAGIDPTHVVVAGDSGNDREMLTAVHGSGPLRAVIVGDHDPELADLAGRRHVHVAEQATCAGVLEGLIAHGW